MLRSDSNQTVLKFSSIIIMHIVLKNNFVVLKPVVTLTKGNETPGVKGWSSSSSWCATYLSSPSSSNTFLSVTMLNSVREDTAMVTALLGLGCRLKASKCLQQPSCSMWSLTFMNVQRCFHWRNDAPSILQANATR